MAKKEIVVLLGKPYVLAERTDGKPGLLCFSEARMKETTQDVAQVLKNMRNRVK